MRVSYSVQNYNRSFFIILMRFNPGIKVNQIAFSSRSIFNLHYNATVVLQSRIKLSNHFIQLFVINLCIFNSSLTSFFNNLFYTRSSLTIENLQIWLIFSSSNLFFNRMKPCNNFCHCFLSFFLKKNGPQSRNRFS